MTTSFRRRLCPSQVRGLVDAEGVGVSPCVNRMEEHASWNKYGVSYSIVFWSKACKVVGIPDFCCMIIFSINFCESRIHAWFLRITCNLSIWSEINWLGAPSQSSRTGTLKSLKSCWNMLEVHPSLLIQWPFHASSQQEVAMMGLSLGFELQELLPSIDQASHGLQKGTSCTLCRGKPSPIGKPWRSFCWDWVPSLHVSVMRFSWLHFGPSISFSSGTGVLEDKHQI